MGRKGSQSANRQKIPRLVALLGFLPSFRLALGQKEKRGSERDLPLAAGEKWPVACRRCDLREQNEQQVGIQSLNHLPHLTWVVIWSVISDGATSRARQREPHGHLQRLVTWHREPAEAPSCHPSRWLLQAPQAAAQRQEENLLYAHCLRLRLQIALKAKKSGLCTRTSWAAMGHRAPSDCRPNRTLSHPG